MLKGWDIWKRQWAITYRNLHYNYVQEEMKNKLHSENPIYPSFKNNFLFPSSILKTELKYA
jgi:hypothetical protein